MLPPVLEIHVVWHPGDTGGAATAQEFVEHFHGTLFSGLIGGAVEVFIRSPGWRSDSDAPRPIPFDDNAIAPGLRAAKAIAVVPLIGNEMAMASREAGSPWQQYLTAIVDARRAQPNRVDIFPCLLDDGAMTGTVPGELFGPFQRIGATPIAEGETTKLARCRDLAQGITHLVSQSKDRLTVFISHTKRNSEGEGETVSTLIQAVRDVLGGTRLRLFFDASDLEPGKEWDPELRAKAASSALLAIRTDLYPSREWCQREILIAKREGMPVIIMDALGDAEERGSFLMDHVPRVPARMEGGGWRKSDIHRAVALLVDECAKRALWRSQQELALKESAVSVAWWDPHAPEPITLTKWLESARAKGGLPPKDQALVVLHPDPPLGAEERTALQDILTLAGVESPLDVMTPRVLAARGG
jgi:hypothetical protein